MTLTFSVPIPPKASSVFVVPLRGSQPLHVYGFSAFSLCFASLVGSVGFVRIPLLSYELEASTVGLVARAHLRAYSKIAFGHLRLEIIKKIYINIYALQHN